MHSMVRLRRSALSATDATANAVHADAGKRFCTERQRGKLDAHTGDRRCLSSSAPPGSASTISVISDPFNAGESFGSYCHSVRVGLISGEELFARFNSEGGAEQLHADVLAALEA